MFPNAIFSNSFFFGGGGRGGGVITTPSLTKRSVCPKVKTILIQKCGENWISLCSYKWGLRAYQLFI